MYLYSCIFFRRIVLSGFDGRISGSLASARAGMYSSEAGVHRMFLAGGYDGAGGDRPCDTRETVTPGGADSVTSLTIPIREGDVSWRR